MEHTAKLSKHVVDNGINFDFRFEEKKKEYIYLVVSLQNKKWLLSMQTLSNFEKAVQFAFPMLVQRHKKDTQPIVVPGSRLISALCFGSLHFFCVTYFHRI